MAGNSKEIVYLRGKLHWAKVLGDPVPNYEKTGNEWVFDLALDSDGVKQMKGLKVNGKPVKNINNRDDERGDYVTFRQKELKKSGDPNRPIKVMDAAGNDWPADQKLGNGTVADVKFEVIDFGKGMYPGVYPRAIRVLEHVGYESQEFAPLSEDDKYFAKAKDAEKAYKMSPAEDKAFKETFMGHTATDEDELNDDVPF